MFEKKYSIEGIIASIIFIILITIVLLQVFGRLNLFVAPIWTEELARWLWVWMAFIGIAEAERQNTQLRMSFLLDAILGQKQKYVFLVADIAYFLITCHLTWIGYKTVLRTRFNETVTMPTTDAVLYASYGVASIFILIRIAMRIKGYWTKNSDQSHPIEGQV